MEIDLLMTTNCSLPPGNKAGLTFPRTLLPRHYSGLWAEFAMPSMDRSFSKSGEPSLQLWVNGVSQIKCTQKCYFSSTSKDTCFNPIPLSHTIEKEGDSVLNRSRWDFHIYGQAVALGQFLHLYNGVKSFPCRAGVTGTCQLLHQAWSYEGVPQYTLVSLSSYSPPAPVIVILLFCH